MKILSLETWFIFFSALAILGYMLSDCGGELLEVIGILGACALLAKGMNNKKPNSKKENK